MILDNNHLDFVLQWFLFILSNGEHFEAKTTRHCDSVKFNSIVLSSKGSKRTKHFIFPGKMRLEPNNELTEADTSCETNSSLTNLFIKSQ